MAGAANGMREEHLAGDISAQRGHGNDKAGTLGLYTSTGRLHIDLGEQQKRHDCQTQRSCVAIKIKNWPAHCREVVMSTAI